MFNFVLSVVVAVLLFRYWGDVTSFLDGVIRSDSTQQVEAQPEAPRADTASSAKASEAPEPNQQAAPAERHPETIQDRLKRMEQ